MAQVKRFAAAGKSIWFTTSKGGKEYAWFLSPITNRPQRINAETARAAIELGVCTLEESK